MTAELPDAIATEFLRVWRRKRLRSLLLWSPAILVLAWAAIVGFLYWRGHGLLHLLGRYWEGNSLWVTLVIIPVPLAVIGTGVLIVVFPRECRAIAVPYCRKCVRVDHALPASCTICDAPFTESRNYVYLSFEDDKALAAFYGLTDESEPLPS